MTEKANSDKLTTECRCFAIIPNDNVKALANLLRGLCYKYSGIDVIEVVMKVPLLSGTASTTIRLSKRATKPDGQANPFQEVQPDR